MKKALVPILILIILLLAILLIWCWRKSRKPVQSGDTFTSSVITSDGENPGEVRIEINCITGQSLISKYTLYSDATGSFKLDRDTLCAAGKYVVNVYKDGYAPVSKVFNNGIPVYKYRLTRATVVTVPVSSPISVQDEESNCQPGLDSAKLYSDAAKRYTFVFDTNGNMIDFLRPHELDAGYANLSKPRCASGTRVFIPSNALVRGGNTPVSGNIKVAVSTVNLAAPDGMPGDNTVRINEQEIGYMMSYGAAFVKAYAEDGEELQLKKGSFAEISIPIDSGVLWAKRDVLDSIPYLTYDMQMGVWTPDGFAKLDRREGVYKKKVSHFSFQNLDIFKTGGSCLQLDASALGIGSNIDVRLVVPGYGEPSVSFTNSGVGGCDPTSCNCRHCILRLPPDTPIGVVVTDGTSTIYENFVMFTNASGYGNNSIGCPDFDQCVPLGGTGAPINPFSTYTCPPGLPCLAARESGTGLTQVTITWFYEFADMSMNKFALYKADFNSGSGTYNAYQNVTSGSISVVSGSWMDWVNGKGGQAVFNVTGQTKFRVVAIETDDGSCTPDPLCPGTGECAPCSDELEINV